MLQHGLSRQQAVGWIEETTTPSQQRRGLLAGTQIGVNGRIVDPSVRLAERFSN